MGHVLVKRINTGHQAENFLAEIMFPSLKEKVGQKVYLGQAYNQHGLVGAYWKCPAIADYLPASLYSLDRQSLGSAGELLSVLRSPLPVSVLETEPVAAPSLQGLYGVSVFFQVILEGQRS